MQGLRVDVTLTDLKAVELAVIRDSNINGEQCPQIQRQRVSDAVAIYCARIIAESQK